MSNGIKAQQVDIAFANFKTAAQQVQNVFQELNANPQAQKEFGKLCKAASPKIGSWIVTRRIS